MTARKTTARKTTARKAAHTTADGTADTVTVTVRRPHAVYWDGHQRGGTLHGVDRQTAEDWQRQGWADIT
ncbi:hypothetical protein [Mycobacterium sp. 852002-51961_SCH5331710]|uniref:hypothetical protein n=1 Tax=Mycobacterium sp. 852002-51961_SCH5331710 TaxID=1834105 RepID=UPI0007FE20D0|nr:hypothetical protein [Mycobacterium sp. 852002-51961_SCH5331710]OBB41238.1 hypothetical protein A5752_08165 [Mycobacterium sp. 852002-51961_SCH5331710]